MRGFRHYMTQSLYLIIRILVVGSTKWIQRKTHRGIGRVEGSVTLQAVTPERFSFSVSLLSFTLHRASSCIRLPVPCSSLSLPF